MSSTNNARDTLVIVDESCEENANTDAIERNIAASLPVIAGLAEATTTESRAAILASAAFEARGAFVVKFGSAFSYEPLSEHSDGGYVARFARQQVVALATS